MEFTTNALIYDERRQRKMVEIRRFNEPSDSLANLFLLWKPDQAAASSSFADGGGSVLSSPNLASASTG